MKSGKFLRGITIKALSSTMVYSSVASATGFISRVWSIDRISFSRSYQNPIQWKRNGSTLFVEFIPLRGRVDAE